MKRALPCLTALFTLGLALPALASGGSEAGIFGLDKLLVETVAAVINFAIFAWILVRYAAPNLKAYFDTNASEYKAKVAEADRVLTEARRVHDEWASRKEKLEQDGARLRQDAISLAEAQARDLLVTAKVAAERIVADAQRSAETELLRAKDDLRAALVEMVMTKTGEKMQSRLTPSHQHLLIEEAIKKLEASQ